MARGELCFTKLYIENTFIKRAIKKGRKCNTETKYSGFYSEKNESLTDPTSPAVSELLVTKRFKHVSCLHRPSEISQPCSGLIRGHFNSVCQLVQCFQLCRALWFCFVSVLFYIFVYVWSKSFHFPTALPVEASWLNSVSKRGKRKLFRFVVFRRAQTLRDYHRLLKPSRETHTDLPAILPSLQTAVPSLSRSASR